MELLVISNDELSRRLAVVRREMQLAGVETLLLGSNVSMFYLTGRVYAGYAFIPMTGEPIFFVRRPSMLSGENVKAVHKVEEIPDKLGTELQELAVEMDVLSYSEISRIVKCFPNAKLQNASKVMRGARSTKTKEQIEMMRHSGIRHVEVYSRIPSMFHPGMTDIELQIEIERQSRLHGSLGQFRIGGTSMEIYAGSLLVGDNADAPSPYDFGMGGAGLDPSLPVGADGSEIRVGQTVMVDMGGDFNGYMTDLTRIYSLGEIPPLASKAQECSINIHHELTKMMHPGTLAADLYHKAFEMAKEAGLEKYFMGHHQQAGFVGHGVGIEINEGPVLAPRSRDVLAVGNTIALEPKFVLPHIGAVGNENTYAIIDAENVENLTPAPEEITPFLR